MSLDDVYRAVAGTPVPATGPGGVQPQTRMVEPTGHRGHTGHLRSDAVPNEVTLNEVDVFMNALADVGRNLGTELRENLRERLLPLSQKSRAEMVARIDDIFENSTEEGEARIKAYKFLAEEGGFLNNS